MNKKYAQTAAEEAARRNQADFSAPKLSTEQEYWDRLGIFTGEQLAMKLAIEEFSDIFKELYGYRPQDLDFKSVEEAEEALANLKLDLEDARIEDEWDEIDYYDSLDEVLSYCSLQPLLENPMFAAATAAGRRAGQARGGTTKTASTKRRKSYTMPSLKRESTQLRIIDLMKKADLTHDGLDPKDPEERKKILQRLKSMDDKALIELLEKIKNPSGFRKALRAIGFKGV